MMLTFFPLVVGVGRKPLNGVKVSVGLKVGQALVASG